MRKKLVIAVVVFAVLATIAVVVLRRSMGDAPANRIRISGNIELTEVDVAFKTAGKLLERTAGEGDSVQKGTILARLDHEQLLRQKEREQAALAFAQAQLAQAGTALRWQQQTW